jgi:hypothetical protein
LTKLDVDLQRAEMKEQSVSEIPPILKELQDELYEKLVNHDKNLRDEIIDYFRENGSSKTLEKYGKYNFNVLRYRSDEQIEKACASESEAYVIDLINRVTKKVGKIIDYKDIYLIGPSINGRIDGERGSTYLQTIVASGPVQRPHYRVLLK